MCFWEDQIIYTLIKFNNTLTEIVIWKEWYHIIPTSISIQNQNIFTSYSNKWAYITVEETALLSYQIFQGDKLLLKKRDIQKMANRLLNAVVRNSHWTSVYCIPTLLNTWKVLAKSIKEHHWSLLEQN